MILFRLMGERARFDEKGGPSIDLWFPTRKAAADAIPDLEPWTSPPAIRRVALPRSAAGMAEMLNSLGGCI